MRPLRQSCLSVCWVAWPVCTSLLQAGGGDAADCFLVTVQGARTYRISVVLTGFKPESPSLATPWLFSHKASAFQHFKSLICLEYHVCSCVDMCWHVPRALGEL